MSPWLAPPPPPRRHQRTQRSGASRIGTTNRYGTATLELVGDLEILSTRQCDAPARLVCKAYTTPECVRRWWGFESSEWVECSIDLRVGGRWRYVTRETRDGQTFPVGFHGEYQEMEAWGLRAQRCPFDRSRRSLFVRLMGGPARVGVGRSGVSECTERLALRAGQLPAIRLRQEFREEDRCEPD